MAFSYVVHQKDVVDKKKNHIKYVICHNFLILSVCNLYLFSIGTCFCCTFNIYYNLYYMHILNMCKQF